MLRRLLGQYHRRRFAWLFAALLATIGARPVLEAFGSARDPFYGLIAATLVLAVVGLVREPGLRWLVAAAAAVVVLGGAWVVFATGSAWAVHRVVWPVGFALAAVAAVRHAFGPGPVDGERIFAALDAYLLAGLLFGAAFWALEARQPGSLGGVARGADVREGIYLSFVTIGTLGYGDVVPKSEAARGLAIVEAVGGQMYLAVLVARLVSLYSRQRDPD